jgi:hypothetical protein
MSAEKARVDRLIILAERLIAALEADITALKSGKPKDMQTQDPEVQRLTALYSREAAQLTPAQAKLVPRDSVQRLTETTRRFRDSLACHTRILTRVRNASEGMIRAVAEEVERRRAPLRTYTPVQMPPERRPTSAMFYNNVV